MSQAKDLNSIVKIKKIKAPIGDAEEKLPIPARRSVINETIAEKSSGSGIASPLTEQSRTTQTVLVYNPDDPTEWIEVEQATQIIFEDANETEIIMDLVP